MKKIISVILTVFLLSFLYGCTQEKLEIPANFDPCAYIDSIRDEAQKEKWCLARDECRMYQDECIPKEVPENMGDICGAITNMPDKAKMKDKCKWYEEKYGCMYIDQPIPDGQCVPINMPENSNWYVCEKINRIPDEEVKKFRCEWMGKKFGCKFENGECVSEVPPQNINIGEQMICMHMNLLMPVDLVDNHIRKSICESNEFCKLDKGTGLCILK